MFFCFFPETLGLEAKDQLWVMLITLCSAPDKPHVRKKKSKKGGQKGERGGEGGREERNRKGEGKEGGSE